MPQVQILPTPRQHTLYISPRYPVLSVDMSVMTQGCTMSDLSITQGWGPRIRKLDV